MRGPALGGAAVPRVDADPAGALAGAAHVDYALVVTMEGPLIQH